MVNNMTLTFFYNELIRDLNVTCVPVKMNDRRPVPFEQAAQELIMRLKRGESLPDGVLFPCVRKNSIDELSAGRITSLEFILLFPFHTDRLGDRDELRFRLFGENMQCIRMEIPPAKGFPFSCAAYDSINEKGIWLGRTLECFDDKGEPACTLLSACVEQLLLDRLDGTNIWNTPPFSAAVNSEQSNYYFHDQFRKNAYFYDNSAESYRLFLSTVISPGAFAD
ncbi:MAG: hypothetical protein ACOX7P_06255 [Oscillospiraceae bacterium]